LSLFSLSIVERWSSEKPSNKHNLITLLIIGGMVFVLLLTLASSAAATSSDSFDGDDLPFLDIFDFIAPLGYVLLGGLSVGLELEVLLIILRLEFMRSHIGEKLPCQSIFSPRQFFLHELISVTARFYRAVTFLFPVHTFDAVNKSGSVFARDRFCRSRGESIYLYQRRFVGYG
jgi:hypothetical protein